MTDKLNGKKVLKLNKTLLVIVGEKNVPLFRSRIGLIKPKTAEFQKKRTATDDGTYTGPFVTPPPGK